MFQTPATAKWLKLGVVEDAQPKTETPAPLPNIFPRSYTRAETLACLESVCGPASRNMGGDHALKSRNIESAIFKHTWDTEFNPRIQEAVRLDVEQDIKTIQRILYLANKGVQFRPTPDLHALRVHISILSKAQKGGSLTDFFVVNWNTSNVTPSLKKEKVEEAKARLTAEEFGLFTDFMELYREQVQDLYLAYAKIGNSLTFRLKRLHPAKPALEALKIDAENVLAAFGKFKRAFPAISQAILGQYGSILKKAQSGTELDKDESDEYMSAVFMVYYIAPIFDPDWRQRLLAVPVDWPALQNKYLAKAAIEEDLRKAQARLLEKEVTDVNVTCRGKLAEADAAQVSGFMKRRTQDLIEEIRRASKRVIGEKFGNLALTLYGPAVDEALFGFDGLSEEYFKSVKQAIESDIESSKIAIRLADQPTPESDQELLGGRLVFSDDDQKDGEKNDIVEECEKIQPRALSDFALTAVGRISVSWYTMSYPQFGMGVLAHEMGHVVSRAVRSQPVDSGLIEQTYMCVANRNPFLMEPISKKEMAGISSPWLEEDFADFFAAQVVKEIREDGRERFKTLGQNLGCALIDDLGDEYGGNSLEPIKDDSHSAGILRMIMQSHDLHELTSQCSPFLGYAKSSSRTLICE